MKLIPTTVLSALAAAALPAAALAQTPAQQPVPHAEARGRMLTEAPLLTFNDVAVFTGHETIIDFEDHATGTQIDGQYAGLFDGAAPVFALSDAGAPQIWLDDMNPHEGLPLGDQALINFAFAPPHGALTIQFGTPVSRVAFEMRATGEEPINLFVKVFRNSEEVGTSFFDVMQEFGLVGIQCAIPFDAIELATGNPTGKAYSLDNLRFELDMVDDDHDGVPNFGDICPGLYNPSQRDRDGDGIGDRCDAFPRDPNNDADGDGLSVLHDNCPTTYNPDQLDADGDGIGDGCDSFPLGIDSDGDGIGDDVDNCPMTPNADQSDCDMDGVGDICDLTLLNPASVTFDVLPGQCVEIEKSVCVPTVPPVVDVLISIDTTNSMSGEIDLLKGEVINFIQDLRLLTGSNLHFALVRYRDYQPFYSSCGYARSYGACTTTETYEVVAPIGSTDAEMLAAVNTLFTCGGGDSPESYTRALWEVTQPDSGINFRPGAAIIVVDFQDDIPHDCDPDQGFVGCSTINTTGIDPGRDEIMFTADDLDLHTSSLAGLLLNSVKLFSIHSGSRFCAWEQYALVTQGTAIQINPNGTVPPGVDLAEEVFDTISSDELIFAVTLRAVEPCGLDISFDPPSVGPIDTSMGGVQFDVTETICVPEGTPEGEYQCLVVAFADGVAFGLQTVTINVGCSTLGFEGLANGLEVESDQFAGQGVTLTSFGLNNFGPAIFDTDWGGPNTGGPDPDLLVNRGNALILQETQPQSVPGIFNSPDDAEFGGSLVFDFDGPVEMQSIDLIDIDAPPPAQTVDIRLIDGSGNVRTYVVPDGWTRDIVNDGAPGFETLDLTDTAPQAGFSALATATEDPGFDPLNVVRMEIDLASSGAIDNVVFCSAD